MEEYTGAVINSGYVTNDPSKIDAALIREQRVEYISRDHARFMALWDQGGQWNVLARAPALAVIVEGVRYRRSRTDSPIGFPMSAPSAIHVRYR